MTVDVPVTQAGARARADVLPSPRRLVWLGVRGGGGPGFGPVKKNRLKYLQKRWI